MDLIIFDFRMPGMDGLETLRAIKALYKNHGKIQKEPIFAFASSYMHEA